MVSYIWIIFWYSLCHIMVACFNDNKVKYRSLVYETPISIEDALSDIPIIIFI
jgi:hypothetical protein